MEKQLYEALLNEKLSKEFIDEFIELCKKHKTHPDSAIDKIYCAKNNIYDTEDVKYMLRLHYGSKFVNNPDNEGIIKEIVNRYRSRYESEYSTWDNISSAIDWVMNYKEV